jgi:pyridoxal phosphate enzyme (YggS family)
MNDLNAKLNKLNARIALACQKARRSPDEVAILAVSKRHSAAKISHLFSCGQRAFGENFLQEALQKQLDLSHLDIEWHFIGPIQSNKTREIAQHFQWVQSVDREKILRRLAEQRPESSPPLNVLLQVNIDREEQKSGTLPEKIPQLVEFVHTLPRLRLRGLMAIPRAANADHNPLNSFQEMFAIFQQLRETNQGLDTLSMGMSADLEKAILAGSTMIRVGTDLFGPRDETNS